MKTSHWNKITGLLCAAGLFAVLHFAQAQTTSDTGSAVATDPDADVSNLSDLEVELKALEMATPLAASNIPASGNFYSAQHAPGSATPWPPLPGNIFQMSAWPLDTNIFVLDDLNFDYNDASVKSSKTTTTSMVAHDDLEGPPTPPGGGGSDTNSPSPQANEMPDYGTNLFFTQLGMVSGNLTGIASNTLADVEYAIQTNSNLTTTNWADTGQLIEGSEVTNWTQFILPPPLSTNNLFFRLQSQASSDGSGIPDWWELKYLGTTSGINPNAQDSAGDGYTIYQKYEMGLNPNTFYTPLAPQGVTVTYDSTTGAATITWLPSPGDVTGYTITDAEGNTYNVTGDSFTETIPYSPESDFVSSGFPSLQNSFQVQAHYANGSSAQSGPVSLQPATVFGSIIPGPSGGNILAVGNIPADAVKVRVFMIFTGGYQYDNGQYNFTIVTNVDIPVSNFTSGLAPAYSSWLNLPTFPQGTYYVWHYLYLQSVDTNGNVSGASPITENWGPDNFYDGREQLKQNLTFQFRVADTISPFGFISFTNYPYVGAAGTTTRVSNPVDYAYAAFYDDHNYNAMYGTELDTPTFNIYRPFADNVLYRNFVYTPSDVDANGNMTTGVQLNNFLDDGTNLDLSLLPTYLPTTNTVSAPLLGSAEYLCTYSAGIVGDDYVHDYGCEGFSYDNDGNFDLDFTNHVANYWGLPFTSAEVYYVDGNTGDNDNTVLNAGGSLSYVGVNAIYMNTTQPQYKTVQYDFWNDNFYGGASEDGGYGLFYDAAGTTNLPGNSAFSPTNTSQLLMVGVGQSIGIAAFAKLEVTNSAYTGVYGYVQQYLTNAYALDDNGNVTANLTGIVSPYGNYFATQAGAAAVVTMPDPDTGQQGTGIVYAVSLNLDKNHDGTMDLSWNGPDATSTNSPYVFWCNNNFDRWDTDGIFDTPDQDDQETANCPYDVYTATPDCNYLYSDGTRVIPCTRDLEDYSRLWINGVTSNLLAALPAGSTITLNWGDVGNPRASNPTIDLFQAADADGGIGYLTNETTSNFQIESDYNPYIGRVAPGGSLKLNAATFANSWAGNHFIWCGVSNGTGGLTLTIADANSNVLAQTIAYIQIKDIKQMYERWTVGDEPSVAPLTNAILSTANLPTGIPAFQYTPTTTPNTPYILHVHGYNMPPWVKDRFGETEYKRLYWQGYQGRFGVFNWPTAENAVQFGNSESQAWLSARGLLNKLENLNAQYPGQVYLTVHSLGNVVAGEALRLATNQVVNTYVAMQGAVSAHAYDPTTPEYTIPAIDDSGTPDCYAYYWTNGAPCYFKDSEGAGSYVNFYNGGDWALSTAWLTFQDLKPSLSGYGFSNSSGTNAYFTIVGGQYKTYFTFPADTYELFANLIQSRSYALGEEDGVSGVFKVNGVNQEVSLPGLWPPDPLNNDYRAHIWHSAEFRDDAANMWQFWYEALHQMGLK
jgi:hypothetical protein